MANTSIAETKNQSPSENLSPSEKRKLTMQRNKEEKAKENPEAVAEVKAPKQKGKKKAAEVKTEATDNDNEDEAAKIEQRAVTQNTASEVSKMLKEKDFKPDLNIKQVREVCETFVQHMTNCVKNNKQFTLTNVATFKRMLRNERCNTNPQIYSKNTVNKDQLQKKIYKPPHYVMVMNVRKKLKDAFESIPVEGEELNEMKNKIEKMKTKKKTGEEEEEDEEEENV